MRVWIGLLLLFSPLAAEDLARPLSFDSLNYLTLSRENREIGEQQRRQEEQSLKEWLKPYSEESLIKLILIWSALPLLALLYFLFKKMLNWWARPAPLTPVPLRAVPQDKNAALLDRDIQRVRSLFGGAPSMTHEELISRIKKEGSEEALVGRVSNLFQISERSLYAHQPVDKETLQRASLLTKEILSKLDTRK